LLLLPAPAAAQADGEPIMLGTYRVLQSRILGEDRVLQVHLPRDYESDTLAYPVVFVFYSDWVEGYFAQMVNDLSHLSMDRMPGRSWSASAIPSAIVISSRGHAPAVNPVRDRRTASSASSGRR
jgi:predicted alpha/beta superfamily hydrolase